MSLGRSSHFLDVRKFTTIEVIDLIKNDEYYSGCCKIIEERKLNGHDILNLTENQITSWKTPKWLMRNLLSLKTSLSQNPEMFLEPEEKNQPLAYNSSSGNSTSKTDFTNKLETLFKPQETQKSRTNNSNKNDNEHGYLKMSSPLQDLYDSNNYLQPLAINNSKQRGIHGKPLPKLPSPPKEPIGAQRRRGRLPAPSREPIALPRIDLQEDENVYEPPPNPSNRNIKARPKSPIEPPDLDIEHNDYEPPPRFSQRPQETDADLVYENPDERIKSSGNLMETKKKSFGRKANSGPVEATPQLPKKIISRKVSPQLPEIPGSNFDQYMNVTGSVENKHGLSTITSRPPAPFQESTKTRKWSTLNRPLPPLPAEHIESTRRQSVGDFRKQSEIEDENLSDDFEDLGVEYENHQNRENSPESENQPEYLNTEETNKISKSNSSTESTSKTAHQIRQQPQINNLLSQLSKVKLKPSNSMRSKEAANEVSRSQLPERRTIRREEVEENHNDQPKSENLSSKAQYKLPAPPPAISEDFSEDLPEYSNTEETNQPPKPNLITEIKSKTFPQSDRNNLLSQISKVRLKSSNPSERKEILLDDMAALDLRQELLQWKSGRKRKNEHESNNTTNEKVGTKSQLKLPTPPTTTSQDYTDESLPEYLNAEETNKAPKSNADVPSKTAREIAYQPQVNDLLSQISSVRLKPSNPVDRKEFTNEEIRPALPRWRSGRNGNKENQNDQTKSENFPTKSKFKLPKPPPAIPQNYTEEYPNSNAAEQTSAKSQFKLPMPPSALPQTFPKAYFDGKAPNQPEVEQDFEHEASETDEEYDNLFNLNNEKFYRYTDRKGARLLLKDLGDGAFVLRPSKKFFLSITVKKKGKYYNIAIMKNDNNKIYCGEGSMRTPEFTSISAFLEYFEIVPLILEGSNGSEEVYLKRTLPEDRF